MKHIAAVVAAILIFAGTALGNSTVFYAGEVNNFGIQILDANLQPDNSRSGDDEHLHIAVVGQKRDGSGGVATGWTVGFAKVPVDTEGNYTVSVTVPAGEDATYGSVQVTVRLADTGWGVSREWNLAPSRWMTAAQYTPPPAATVIAGAVVAQITPPPSAQTIAGAVNTTLSSAHGAGLWGQQAEGANVVNITCQSADPTPVAIPGATVQIRGPETGALVYYGVTSADGKIAANLDAGDYSIYAFKTGQYTFTNPATLTVDEDPEAVTLTGTAFSPATPLEPNTCMVYGWAYDAHGTLQPGAAVKVTFSSNYGTYGNNQIVKKTWTGTANGSAYWEVPCVPNVLIYPDGTSYTFEIGAFKYSGLVVPEAPSVAFDQVLNPPTPTPTPTRTPTPTATP